MKETEYWHSTDTFEQKLELLRAASERRDFRLARALTESLKNTLVFSQQEEESLGVPLLRANAFGHVAELPPPWQEWARGWLYYKVLALDETAALARTGEPVELVAAFRTDQTDSLAREVRVARIDAANGELREVPCQVSSELRRGAERMCRLVLLVDSPAHARTSYLVLYGNPELSSPPIRPIFGYRVRAMRWTSRTTTSVPRFPVRWDLRAVWPRLGQATEGHLLPALDRQRHSCDSKLRGQSHWLRGRLRLFAPNPFGSLTSR